MEQKNKSGSGFAPTSKAPRTRGLILPAALLAILIFIIVFSLKCTGGQSASDGPSPANEQAALRFPEGSYVESIPLGGLTREEAAEALGSAVQKKRDGYRCTLRFGNEERVLDPSELTLTDDLDRALDAAMASPGRYSVRVKPESNARLAYAVETAAAFFDREPKRAELLSLDLTAGETIAQSNARFAVTAPVDGVRIDRAAAVREIADGARAVELKAEAIPAEGETPELPARLALFSTSFAGGALSSENRVKNIKKAASMLNVRSLERGETLSVNAVLGKRTPQEGWLEATAFANGGAETVQAPGGGICQVSTTLYNCAMLAGLDAPERHGHSRRVSYADGGRDAALDYETADLVIKNTTEGRVYIFMWADADEKRLYCEIYGKPSAEYDEIRLESELVETTEPAEPEFSPDPNLADGECVLIRSAINGSVYRTYRVFLKDGSEKGREMIAETVYPMHPALYAVHG